MRCSPTSDAPPTGFLAPGGATPHLPGWQPAKYSHAQKPAGGFALLPLETLVLPWLAYEQGVIETLALRGYLASIEMRERRCGAAPETPMVYTTEELRRLLGATVRPSTAAAVRQGLVAVGLLTWPDDGHQVALCPQGTTVPWLDLPRYTALRAAIHPSVQQIPLPRRLLTWLAAAGAPGLIATVLGVACRALRYRAHQVIAGGSLVPAWVATTFHVARRTVAHWLQHLRALGWLAPLATPPAHRAAYGPWLAVNLCWAPPGSARPGRKNLASGPHQPRTNLASPHQNLATVTPQNSPETPDRTRASGAPPPPHGNPLRETQPFKHHKNLDGTRTGGQGAPPSGADPAMPYTTLPPETQAALYHEAETRLRQQYPADFVIRPVVLAAVYRLLEAPRPPLPPGDNTVPTLGPHPRVPDGGCTTPPPLGETRRMTEFSRSPHPPPVVPAPLSRHSPPTPQAERAGASTTPTPHAAWDHAPMTSQHPSDLQAITPRDLANVARLQRLWHAAQGRGWIGESDADWLTVVTTSQHALRVGYNPGGLFVAILHQRAWHLLTQADEDAARQVLRAAHGPLTASERGILRQVFGRHAAGPPVPQVPPLSHAAHCAREALHLCQTARWSGDPFTVVKAAEPAWTRTSWEAALAELEQYHLLQQVANAQQQRAQAHAAVYEADESHEWEED